MKFPDEFVPLLYRLLEFAEGDRSKLLVGVQPIQYLPGVALILDIDPSSRANSLAQRAKC